MVRRRSLDGLELDAEQGVDKTQEQPRDPSASGVHTGTTKSTNQLPKSLFSSKSQGLCSRTPKKGFMYHKKVSEASEVEIISWPYQ